MATWVTHLMLADCILQKLPILDRQGFCVGSIAPDCNVENEDWTQFDPPREVTHWMVSERKAASDCDRFFEEYIRRRTRKNLSNQEISFLMGYYAHLIADAEFQRYIRDEERVKEAWKRTMRFPEFSERAQSIPASWDSIKALVGKAEMKKDIGTIEAEYLETHPDSGYLTEILPLKSYPDYIDYLPKGAIVRKVGVMGSLPKKETGRYPFTAISREEYTIYLQNATKLILRQIREKQKASP